MRKIAKVDEKVVAVCSSRYKGNFYFFSFDFASGGDYQKLAFVESVLEMVDTTKYLYCSDPSVTLSFQMGPKKGLLVVVVPPPGELSDGLEASRKEIIIRADLRKGGFSSARVKLTPILDGEEAQPIKTTAKDLREGIPLTVDYPDGVIMLVEKR